MGVFSISKEPWRPPYVTYAARIERSEIRGSNGARGRSLIRSPRRRAAARSVACIDRPVTLPPGRASDATKTGPNRVHRNREDNRDERCRLL